jgi:hypothetical protein
MDRQSTRKLTKTKRQSQTCKVYELKVDKSHLSQKSLDHLYSLFREAKWFYNYCLSLENINEAVTELSCLHEHIDSAECISLSARFLSFE